MKISGFTFTRNSLVLGYPLIESIQSALPFVDEYVIALGEGDENDKSFEEIQKIGSDKIKVIKTEWDLEKYKRRSVHAQQTDLAKSHCTGDWLLYLQADELIHEKDFEEIRSKCKKYLNDDKVEGLTFDYLHFWGDYDHYHLSHNWYPREVRMIKNNGNIHSFRGAQSFRTYFDEHRLTEEDYYRKENSRFVNAKPMKANIYHYGFVRHPEVMSKKTKSFKKSYKGHDYKDTKKIGDVALFDYGPLNQIETFKGTHPKAMQERIQQLDWKHLLQYDGKPDPKRALHKHEKFKYKLLTKVERLLLPKNKRFSRYKGFNLI